MPRDPSDVPDAVLRVAHASGLATGLGPVTWGRLLSQGWDAEGLVRAREGELAGCGGITLARAGAIVAAIGSALPAAERAAMVQAGARAVVLGDPDYPDCLSQTHDPPAMLWVRGQWEPMFEESWRVGIVGSREASVGGQSFAFDLARSLGDASCAIVSGGARGIDAAAHRGALSTGAPTMVILGCGLGQCYPAEHEALYASVLEAGGVLVSELPMAALPLGHHFPRRNRILAALVDAVVVVEARARSGALITARLACDLGREVCCVPGRPTDAQSEGCHIAIREGWASLVRGTDDILEALRGNLWRVDRTERSEEQVDSAPSPPT